MSSWTPQSGEPGTSGIHRDLVVAGLGSRLGAWFFDLLVFSGIALLVFMFGALAGVVQVTPEAMAQIQANSNAQPTVPLFAVNTAGLMLVSIACVAAIVAFAAWCWASYRATPGQRLLGIQVVDESTGKSLPLGRALVRSVLLYGLVWSSLIAVLALLLEQMSIESPQTLAATNYGIPAGSFLAGWAWVSEAASTIVLIWPLALILAAILDVDRRSLHDRVSGSLVTSGVLLSARPADRTPYGQRPPYAQPPYAQRPPYAQPPYPQRPPYAQPPYGAPPAPGETPAPTGLLPQDRPTAWRPPDSWEPTGHEESSPPRDDEVWQTGWDEPKGLPKRMARSATLGRRSIAYVMDSILLLGFYLLMLQLTGAGASAASATASGDLGQFEKPAILAGLLAGLFQLFYFVGSWALWKGTPCQRLLNLEVAREPNGDSLPWGDGLVRWAILQGPFALWAILPLAFRFVGLFSAAAWTLALIWATVSSPGGRGPHDRAVNSRVTVASDTYERF